MRADHKHTANVADLSAVFNLRPHHESRSIHQGHHRQAMRIAKLHEARCLVRAFRFNSPSLVLAVIGYNAKWLALDAYKTRIIPGPNLGLSSRNESVSAIVFMIARTS